MNWISNYVRPRINSIFSRREVPYMFASIRDQGLLRTCIVAAASVTAANGGGRNAYPMENPRPRNRAGAGKQTPAGNELPRALSCEGWGGRGVRYFRRRSRNERAGMIALPLLVLPLLPFGGTSLGPEWPLLYLAR